MRTWPSVWHVHTASVSIGPGDSLPLVLLDLSKVERSLFGEVREAAAVRAPQPVADHAHGGLPVLCRGRPVAVKPKAASAAVKVEPGLEPLGDMQPLQQQQHVWRVPHQPLQQSAACEALPVSGGQQYLL